MWSNGRSRVLIFFYVRQIGTDFIGIEKGVSTFKTITWEWPHSLSLSLYVLSGSTLFFFWANKVTCEVINATTKHALLFGAILYIFNYLVVLSILGWLNVNWIPSIKWMQEKMIFRKENKIRIFGSTMKNSPENDFRCLITFWKCYFLIKFSHFLSSQTNFITKKIHNIHFTQPKIKINTFFIHKLSERRKKEWEIEGKRDWSGKRIGVDGSGGQIGWVWGWSGDQNKKNS